MSEPPELSPNEGEVVRVRRVVSVLVRLTARREDELSLTRDRLSPDSTRNRQCRRPGAYWDAWISVCDLW
jgi:hypothetical protein